MILKTKNTALGSSQISPDPLAGGKGLAVPSLRTFGLEFRPFGLASMKNPGHAPDSGGAKHCNSSSVVERSLQKNSASI